MLLAASIPWFQARSRSKNELEQVYTPITSLLGQVRYLYFLLSVLCASFFFFFIKMANSGGVPGALKDPQIILCAEILTCWVTSLLCPHRIPPQLFFLLAQILIASSYWISFFVPSGVEVISAVGFVVFSVANAQIVATHGRPGLEYTTCALVDITRNGLGPILFFLLKSDLNSVNLALIVCTIFPLGFLGKYFFVDYPHDELIKKKLSTHIFINI